jgi:ribose transport system ATP-binding protein
MEEATTAPAATAVTGSDGEPILALRGLSKRFGGTRALQRVDLELRRGEVLALLGENGAGKSTLIKILAGVYRPDAGEIIYKGKVAGSPPKNLPIAFIHQDLGLIDWMTVSENICLSLGYPRRMGLVDFKAARRRAGAALDKIGAAIDPDVRAQSLSRTEKSLVAICRALASDAEVIVLDEPTASLPGNEVKRLFDVIERLRASGVAMIYVSHRIDEVFDISDRIVVLRDGCVVGERATAETTAREVILMIIGNEPGQIFLRATSSAGEARLVLNQLCVPGVGPVDCQFRKGEVVGLFGLRGAGQEQIGRALFGLVPFLKGSAVLDGRAIAPTSPADAMAAGIDLVWGDRVAGSIVPMLSVQENMFLNPTFAGLHNLSYIAPSAERAAARELGRQVSLRPNKPDLPVEALSGGNQQKVVVGRWLHLRGNVYIFEDPTAGVDVGAKADIYRLFHVALQTGATIVIVSTDVEEVASVCHRVLVFDRGRVVAELTGPELTTSRLLAWASASTAIEPAS